MSSKKARRALGIDLLRLLAAVQMISGHTIDALIDPALRTGEAWARWTMIRGLTAVAFLFASGVSFAMVAAQSPDRRGPRIRRALTLIAISYALHPPVALFSADDAARARSIADFFAVDVLACIGVTLLCLEGLARIGPRAFAWGSGALGLFAILIAPALAHVAPSGIAMPLLDYVTKSGGSLFPVVPYAGFALLGAAIGTAARPREPGSRALVVLGVTAVVLALVAYVWDASTIEGPTPATHYAYPSASFGRLAAVVGIAFVLTLATSRIASLPHWMTTLAGETLFLYVSHLLLLYVGGVGLVHWIGPSLSLETSAAVAAALIAVCTAASLAWARYRDAQRS
jgi:acyltransferase